MDKESAAVVEQGGMPNGDDAERAVDYITKALSQREDFQKAWMGRDEPDPMFVEVENVHRCLVAFLAVMRMHEAKQEHGVGEQPKH